MFSGQLARADDADDLLKEAAELVNKGKSKEGLEIAGKAIKADPVKGLFGRAAIFEVLRQHDKALADYNGLIKRDPKLAEAYNQRGSVHFKMGHIKESLADFNRFLELKPKEKSGHWKRGISLYYAGDFKEGRKQFEGYEAVDTNDVENAVWHFLCVARSDGIEKARKAMLKIGKDKRIPMMEVYDLYLGKIKPEDVLTAAKKVDANAKPEVLRGQLFYAHLYLGLYYEVKGDRKKALEHMTQAAKKYVIGHYMGDVARVHLQLLTKKK
jgi:lipoprotein NlpI